MIETYSKEHIHRIAPMLEPGTPLGEADVKGNRAVAIGVSIAISLKRIADAMTQTGEGGSYSAYDAIQRWCYENCQ